LKPVVDPRFWTAIIKITNYAYMVMYNSWKNAPVDPKTGCRTGKIAMYINYN